MADWLQTRRELMCLEAIDRFGPVRDFAINALIGMPLQCVRRHLLALEEQGRVASYVGYDERSGEDDAPLWAIQGQAPRVGWSSEMLILFCGEESPSVMEEDDTIPAEEADGV